MNSEDRAALVRYRMARASEVLAEVHVHVEHRFWNTAVNRLYYACYYAVSALLVSKGISATTHSGVRQMFGLHFIKEELIPKDLGKFYSDIFDMRQTGDYEDYLDFTEEDVLDLQEPAQRLIETISVILRQET
jgi:uncharacterized protein (UPF0332 family)